MMIYCGPPGPFRMITWTWVLCVVVHAATEGVRGSVGFFGPFCFLLFYLGSQVVFLVRVVVAGTVGGDGVFAGRERLDAGIATRRFQSLAPLVRRQAAFHEPIPRFVVVGQAVGGRKGRRRRRRRDNGGHRTFVVVEPHRLLEMADGRLCRRPAAAPTQTVLMVIVVVVDVVGPEDGRRRRRLCRTRRRHQQRRRVVL